MKRLQRVGQQRESRWQFALVPVLLVFHCRRLVSRSKTALLQLRLKLLWRQSRNVEVWLKTSIGAILYLSHLSNAMNSHLATLNHFVTLGIVSFGERSDAANCFSMCTYLGPVSQNWALKME